MTKKDEKKKEKSPIFYIAISIAIAIIVLIVYIVIDNYKEKNNTMNNLTSTTVNECFNGYVDFLRSLSNDPKSHTDIKYIECKKYNGEFDDDNVEIIDSNFNNYTNIYTCGYTLDLYTLYGGQYNDTIKEYAMVAYNKKTNKIDYMRFIDDMKSQDYGKFNIIGNCSIDGKYSDKILN